MDAADSRGAAAAADDDGFFLPVACPSPGCRSDSLNPARLKAHFDQYHAPAPDNLGLNVCHRCSLSGAGVVKVRGGHARRDNRDRCKHQLCGECVIAVVNEHIADSIVAADAVRAGAPPLAPAPASDPAAALIPATCILCDSKERVAAGLAAQFMALVWPRATLITPPPLEPALVAAYAARVHAHLLAGVDTEMRQRLLERAQTLTTLERAIERQGANNQAFYRPVGGEAEAADQALVDALNAVTRMLQSAVYLMVSIEGDARMHADAAATSDAPEQTGRAMRTDLPQEYAEGIAVCHVLATLGIRCLLAGPRALLPLLESWLQRFIMPAQPVADAVLGLLDLLLQPTTPGAVLASMRVDRPSDMLDYHWQTLARNLNAEAVAQLPIGDRLLRVQHDLQEGVDRYNRQNAIIDSGMLGVMGAAPSAPMEEDADLDHRGANEAGCDESEFDANDGTRRAANTSRESHEDGDAGRAANDSRASNEDDAGAGNTANAFRVSQDTGAGHAANGSRALQVDAGAGYRAVKLEAAGSPDRLDGTANATRLDDSQATGTAVTASHPADPTTRDDAVDDDTSAHGAGRRLPKRVKGEPPT